MKLKSNVGFRALAREVNVTLGPGGPQMGWEVRFTCLLPMAGMLSCMCTMYPQVRLALEMNGRCMHNCPFCL